MDRGDHVYGHRQRLKKRVLEAPSSLADYEVLEALLTFFIPRRDVKPLAKTMLAQAGSLGEVLSKEEETYEGLGEHGRVGLCVIREILRRVIHSGVRERPLVDSVEALRPYLHFDLSHRTHEHFRVFFLDRGQRLLAQEYLHEGTLDYAAVYPREILKMALKTDAAGLILAHNHPSGDPTPSREDIEMTRVLQSLCISLNLHLQDHLIVGGNDIVSFRALALLD